nr:PREDICTED: zinc finger FYVE domain-containing protein 9 isoform X1 [Lepisosteus oculatus]XP_015210829.1 PREDICTED: zinc finger FYVE domain-containing protein 9 isoform X1 [Lepisosteus oculatus]XP_015210830.1 PREDICTED: zinc finger FYVE domain-containing protein 9 isoform X1 [Lepisosteus oculatus]XP_015210831.1 PREDICTED: zinc finger FYVE domain-containing protein 9 isoform X1 [Lepisosteus oculatus]XP_015210832.1 PREDICTED: zinc finger FYVE domain-containing protein 9 isoform X1 [Lepisosteus 
MENYFQAEAFNLDKVLDEFEQNEDETDPPAVSDTKWTQILTPSPHLLSLNPALACPGGNTSDGQLPLPENPTASREGTQGDCCANGSQDPQTPEAAASAIQDRRSGEQFGSLGRNGDSGPHPPPSRRNVDGNAGGGDGQLSAGAGDGRTLLSKDVWSRPAVCGKENTALDNGGPAVPDVNGCAEGVLCDRPPFEAGSPDWNGIIAVNCSSATQEGGSVKKDRDCAFLGTFAEGKEKDGLVAANECTFKDPTGRTASQPPGCDDAANGSPKGDQNAGGLGFEGGTGHAALAEELGCGNGESDSPDESLLGTAQPASEAHAHSGGVMCDVSMGLDESPQEEGNQPSRPQVSSTGELKKMEERLGPGQSSASSNGEKDLECAFSSESPSTVSFLPNGLDGEGLGKDQDDESSQPLPSKEDSVTEEKEVEESKMECYEQTRGLEAGQGNTGASPAVQKLNNSSVQPVSIPYGGARPKQPVSLKLQIPRPLSGQVQNELGPHGKNKNLEPQGRPCAGDLSCANGYSEEAGTTGVNGENEGAFDSGASLAPPGLLLPAESPDNDLQAGHLGQLSKKTFTALGEVAPVWVPDSQAPICMKCEVKFTFTKRRHHCRACGKVFCAACCSLKCRLVYMDRKEARVCVTCHSVLMNVQAWESMVSTCNQSPNPNNPAEYCSTIPPLQQAQASGALSSPPPTVMVPVGVLKHPGTEGSLPREQRRVWFADGILPNGEVADSSKVAVSGAAPSGPLTVSHDSCKPPAANPCASEAASPARAAAAPPVGSPVGSSVNLIPEDGLPPILISTGVKGGTGSQLTDYAVEERPSEIAVMQQLEEGGPDPLVFVLNANLLAMVKLVNYVNRKCWCVTTKGMHAVGQAEAVVLLQCLPDEKSIPKDVFSHFVQLYQDALAGNVVSNLGHSFFTQSFLGSKEHGGFLYISPTFQSLQDLLLPNPPYLFGILIQKWETPWAKVFPIRLMLRLGAEYQFYPCPLFSVRFRKPLFGETGHTIMNLLADFRNYQYTLPVVNGLMVDMEVRKTCIKIPSNRYNELMKAMNKSNEHVLAMGACFNERADSHLVCVQNDDGNYQTQAISIHNQPRKVTGACFFVFSGALKPSSGYLAKSSIVEDGVMVQITAETMEALRQALREMKDFSFPCGKADQEESQEHVSVQWLEDDRSFNKGVISPIDGRSLESITSVKIFHGAEYKASGKVIRWTEAFFLQSDEQPNGLSDPADHSRLTENVARAFCVALCPHLKLLKEDGMAKLGLRVTLDADQVGYQAGSNGQPLLPQYMNDLDSALVPVIHSGACQLSEGPVVMELIFYILEHIS